MGRKTFMAIHTFHSDQAKKEFFGGMPEIVTTDREWAEYWFLKNIGAWKLVPEKTISFLRLPR